MTKKNCWEIMKCGKGPNSENCCSVVTHKKSNGYLGGTNGGRACFYVKDTQCSDHNEAYEGNITEKILRQCMNCEFFKLIQIEEGRNSNLFHYLKFLHDKSEDKRDRFNITMELFND